MINITSSLKIIHITASYKPAYIYGGPIQSVGKLCEVLSGDKRIAVLKEEILRCTQDDKLGIQNGNPSNQDDKYSAEDGKRVNVKVITTTANGTKELDVKTGVPVLIEGVPVTYFKRWTKDHSHFSPGLLWRLRKTLRQAQGDKIVVHIHAWWNLVSILSCFIAKWYKIRVVLSPRGMLTSYTLANRNSLSKKLIHKLLGKNLLKYCHIHATSEQEKADILKIVKPKSIRVIPNLVSLPSQVGSPYQVASIKNQDEDCFKLIFLSRIEEKKGLELLFNALATVDIAWKLTIAGSGEEKYLQDLKLLANKLKLGDNIYWIGQVSNEDKYTLIAAHDLLVLTSYNENFANVVVESFSVGTPVLISEYVGLAEYVKDNELGWVTSLETNEIKNNIISAYQNPEKRQKISDIAPSTIREDFNDEVLANRYLEFYNTI
ncbi:glycosyltransferase [Pedobacter sp. HDW13]|uniref:XrtY-associated glycosyltransferase XYAG1 n=1 Tax=Pedobacter sp. HDW13 TaxID=2714940 RepID=UPI00140E53EB|nr:glycosyltransferase [Pedobacter sp. HDW13]QIL40657.1 glycosyltransferase [Pedobacter sp. HDW13]